MVKHKYSTFWPRFWAGIIDGLIFSPLGFFYSSAYPQLSIPLRIVAFAINAGAIIVYEIWMHRRYGQTLGKMICKVIVLDVSEGRLSFKQAVLRDIFDIIAFALSLMLSIPLIVQGVDVSVPENLTRADWVLTYSGLIWFAVELITMLSNNKRRALHDFIAGSVVVRKEAMACEGASTARVST